MIAKKSNNTNYPKGNSTILFISLFLVIIQIWFFGEDISDLFFVKSICTIIVLACSPFLGKLGITTGEKITTLFSPDAVFSSSSVHNTLTLIGWYYLPRLILCYLAQAIPLFIIWGTISSLS